MDQGERIIGQRIFTLLTAAALLLIGGSGTNAAAGTQTWSHQADAAPSLNSTADHSKFGALSGPFASGPEVTQACLKCHTEAAKQVQRSIHWTWELAPPEHDRKFGKRHVLNNLCLGIAGSYRRCTSCHVGYGWDDSDFDFDAEENVDCLVCHDTTGTYVKFPTGAGHPPYEDTPFRGRLIEAPDLAYVAQHVGPSSRETCGSCHFEGGGGDAIKHGDLDSSLIDPPYSIDVHMSPEGGDFTCSSCHLLTGHLHGGSRYRVSAGESITQQTQRPPACSACHGSDPHQGDLHDKLNQHSDFIACQTCHVPAIARSGQPTKTLWDWSMAGRMDEDGRPIVEKENGRVIYDGMKGSFAWNEDYPPEYHWFNGRMEYTLLGDPIDPDAVVELNTPLGSPQEADAKIWPFKSMQGRQPFDRVHQTLLVAQLFGNDQEAYWNGYDWHEALTAGMEEARRTGQTEATFSGEFGFVDTRMYWPMTHMVAPAQESLGCQACHSADGRLSGVDGLYVVGQDRHPRIERIGWGVVTLLLIAVTIHGGIRYTLYRRNRMSHSQGETSS